MALSIEIETGNDAFEGDNAALECARILKEVSFKLLAGETSGRCADYNGNRVGKWELTE